MAPGSRARIFLSAAFANAPISGVYFAMNSANCASGFMTDLFFDRGLLDVVELWEFLHQVGIAFRLKASLIGALALRWSIAVSAINFVDDIHSLAHFDEGSETLTIKERVVSKT